ncbi:TonB-dependent siderophore receptor [Pantoea sp. 18069]|uniref:TonB-dependent siderophore receptor n=1 Tax=Pantoea sp. 18069 TaxID=2681415 RepID=UPI0013574084|nr:TonB-dependent siderophore receptor [Pantoea sp. 18069]
MAYSPSPAFSRSFEPGHRPSAPAWACRSLLALACAGLTAPAWAQTPDTAVSAAAARSYQIPAGPLEDALNRFGRASGALLSFTQDQVQGLRSPGLEGRFESREALQRLLVGTGLALYQTPQGGFTLRKAPAPAAAAPGDVALSTVTVTSQRDSAVQHYVGNERSASSKLGSALRETPRSISIVTQEQLKNQAPKSIEQALSYTAGVTTEVTGADVRMTGAMIRGFSDGSSYYKDGLRLFAAGSYGSWNDEIDELESIEVVKGPASVLFGQGRPGGVINVLSKRPSADHVNSVGLSLGRYDRVQATADLGGTLDDDGRLLYRLNLKARDSDGRTVGSRDDRIAIAPSLRWKLGDQTQLTLLANYSEERGSPKSWWPSLFSYPQIKDLPARLTAGDPSFDRFNRDTRSLGYEFSHQTDGGWLLTQNLRYSTIDIDYRHIYAMDVLADGRSVTRANLAQQTRGRTLTVDSRVQKDLEWGALQHKLVLGLDHVKYRESGGLGFGWDVPNLDLQAPVYGQSIAAPELEDSSSSLRQTGVYALNQLKWDRWVANLSLRHDKAHTTQLSTTQPYMDDSATTGSAGLLYQFDNGLAPYASYATSFDPVTGLQFDGSTFKPRRGKQYEVGVKYQPAGSTTLLTASLFDLTQTNVSTQDPDHPRFSVQTGEVRSTGIELEGRFALTREVGALASFTYTDPRTTQSTRPAEIGRQTLLTSKRLVSLWLDYRPRQAPGLMVAGGLRYKSASPYNVAADGRLNSSPGVTLADLAVAYQTPRYRVALNVNNLFDKKYFAGIFRGVDREATLSFNYYW